MKKLTILTFFSLIIGLQSFAQKAAEPSPYDFGKMWTFENPPLDYFQETYDWRPDDNWLTKARRAALRMSTGCSASFVSPNGLVMTNHHCSRDAVGLVTKDGEDIDANGFVAETLADERKAEGIYFEQLNQYADITDYVLSYTSKATTDQERLELRAEAFEKVQEEYKGKFAWQNLRMQVVTYYSGGKFSLYGYKKYDDVRLVLIPELQLGFYGGDPDNFTFPRYALDCTFWRVYEDDKPVNTVSTFFPFNGNGVKEGEPVFVIGNPGNTERYRTVAQLEYDRDYRYPMQLSRMNSDYKILSEVYEENPSINLLNQIFSTSNGIKSITGVVEGLQTPSLFGRKVAMEEKIKAASSNKDYWVKLTEGYKALEPFVTEISFLGPTRGMKKTVNLAHMANTYEQMLSSPDAPAEEIDKMKAQIKETAADLNNPLETKFLTAFFSQLKEFGSKDDVYITKLLGGLSPADAAKNLLKTTLFNDPAKIDQFFGLKSGDLSSHKDPILEMGRMIVPKFQESITAFRSSSPSRRALESKIAGEAFKVYGSSLPPDATFTLRLADGVVKGYDYNGTQAPYYTTFFGMYDRHYSFNKEFPWSLPEKWNNPPMELLKSPINFVSTNDIIGGNSGSPVINKNLEVVGLIFDGNIESLPGNFIFDDTYNRSVSVHAGGMMAALKYIYKAKRLYLELEGGMSLRGGDMKLKENGKQMKEDGKKNKKLKLKKDKN